MWMESCLELNENSYSTIKHLSIPVNAGGWVLLVPLAFMIVQGKSWCHECATQLRLYLMLQVTSTPCLCFILI